MGGQMQPKRLLISKKTLVVNAPLFRKLRRQHEINIVDVAERAGMVQSHVSDIERSVKPASERASKAMVSALLELIEEGRQ
jgi:predicted transcriptional regulator